MVQDLVHQGPCYHDDWESDWESASSSSDDEAMPSLEPHDHNDEYSFGVYDTETTEESIVIVDEEDTFDDEDEFSTSRFVGHCMVDLLEMEFNQSDYDTTIEEVNEGAVGLHEMEFDQDDYDTTVEEANKGGVCWICPQSITNDMCRLLLGGD